MGDEQEQMRRELRHYVDGLSPGQVEALWRLLCAGLDGRSYEPLPVRRLRATELSASGEDDPPDCEESP